MAEAELTCSTCHCDLVPAESDLPFRSREFAGQAIIQSVPIYRCPRCGFELVDGPLLLRLHEFAKAALAVAQTSGQKPAPELLLGFPKAA